MRLKVLKSDQFLAAQRAGLQREAMAKGVVVPRQNTQPAPLPRTQYGFIEAVLLIMLCAVAFAIFLGESDPTYEEVVAVKLQAQKSEKASALFQERLAGDKKMTRSDLAKLSKDVDAILIRELAAKK